MIAPSGAHLNVVAFGGGTGMPVLLQGLKKHVSSLTAIVVVSDDGGSSGELRTLYDMPAPGDLRNVIAALSEAEPELVKLIQYRFDDPILEGHSFGNLALAAFTKMEGGFEQAVQALCRLAKVKGTVIPMALEKLALEATHQDGSKSMGEVTVSKSDKPITKLKLHPDPQPASKACLEAIAQADVVVMGPGSLFTSVIPHLLMPGVCEALTQSRAKIVYVANIMTEPGETTRFDLNDHVQTLIHHGLPRLDAVLSHNGNIPNELKKRYENVGSHAVRATELHHEAELWIDDIIDAGEVLRHSSTRLAESLLSRLGELVK